MTAPRALDVGASLGFVLLIAGSNLPYPLFPSYSDIHGLDATGVAFVFVTYFAVLVPTLVVMARPAAQRHAVGMLIAALGFAVAADVALASQTLSGLFVGRALSGVSVGLGTGAAAAVVRAVSENTARTTAATGNFIGALSGILLTIVTVELVPTGRGLGYVLHGAACIAAVAWLAWSLRRQRPIRTRGPVFVDGAGSDRSAAAPWIGYALGVSAWSAAGLVITFVPLAASEVLESTSLFVANLPIIAMLASGAIGQFVLGGKEGARAWGSILALTMGLSLLPIGFALQSFSILVAASALSGFGQAPSYRIGMRMVTAGLDPRRQGARASGYAGVAYGTSAVIVLVVSTLIG